MFRKPGSEALALLLAGSALVAACAGGGAGGSGSGGSALTITKDAGEVHVIARAAGGVAAAELFSDVQPAHATTVRLDDDQCKPRPTSAGPTTSVPLDAGTSLALVTSTSSIAIPATGVGSWAASGLELAADGDYALTNSGGPDLPAGTIAQLHTPKQPVLLGVATPPPITPGTPLDLTFTTPTGASTVIIEVTGGSGASAVDYLCDSKDDGTFTIPAEVTSAAGAGATYTISAVSLQKVSLAGRDLLVRAETH